MKRVIAIDCETDPFERGEMVEPFLWGAYDGEKYLEFERREEIAAWLKEQDAIVYAHNGGKFDHLFLMDFAARGSPVTVIKGRVARWYLGLAEMRDSFNLFPLPLAAYQKDKFAYSKLARDVRRKHWREIQRYLRHDCEFLWEMITRFRREHSTRLTLASSALDRWQSARGGEVEHSNARFFDRWKPWFFGGRVQALRHGILPGPWYLVDVVSAYPAAMLSDHPAGLKFRRVRGQVVGSDFLLIEARSRGAFPVREKSGLCFPDMRGEFRVTGWELLAARETGRADHVTVRGHWRFEAQENYADYVHYYSDARRIAKANGDAGGSLFCKLMQNSLYGKFGADPRNYREMVLMDADAGFAGAPWVGRWALVDAGPAEHSRFFNVARSASITGYQRAVMLRALSCVRDPIYCDTDSILCRDYSGLETGSTLGCWEWDKSVYERAAIGGKKLYALKKRDGSYKLASKGVKLTGAEIERVARGKEVRYLREAPSLSAVTGYRRVERVVRATA